LAQGAEGKNQNLKKKGRGGGEKMMFLVKNRGGGERRQAMRPPRKVKKEAGKQERKNKFNCKKVLGDEPELGEW